LAAVLLVALGWLVSPIGSSAPSAGPQAQLAELAAEAGPTATAEPEPSPTPPPPTVVDASARYLFFGDIFFGRYINDWSMASPLGYDYPFQNLAEFQPQNYNAWVANFECPTVAGDTTSSAEMERTLEFNCDPGYLPNVAKWYTAVSLGNNHTDNRGWDGFATTQEEMTANGIQYFGSPDPENGPNCNVVVLPITAKWSDGTSEELSLPLGFCGWDGVFKNPTASQLAEITEYAALLPTISYPHSGAENVATPDQIKTTLYRDMIDAGAEMVIGNHPHWIQTTEAYQGKLIVHSMGNFIFDQQRTMEQTRSAMIDVRLTVDDPAALEAWSDIAEQCRQDFEGCKQAARQAGLARLTLSYTFDALGSNDADKLVKPATEAELADIKARLQWDSTMAGLAD